MANKVAHEGTKELRWLRVGPYLVTYMEPGTVYDDGVWNDWIQAFSHRSVQAMFICSWDPTEPSHQQWRRATRAMRDHELAVAVVTEARHNLALAKAASWLGTNIQSFRWQELKDACEFIGIDKKLVPGVRAKLVALRDAYGRVTGDSTLTSTEVSRASHKRDGSMAVDSSMVLETSGEIQATLAALQSRLRNRPKLPTELGSKD